jgi:hypothetical protein
VAFELRRPHNTLKTGKIFITYSKNLRVLILQEHLFHRRSYIGLIPLMAAARVSGPPRAPNAAFIVSLVLLSSKGRIFNPIGVDLPLIEHF